MEREIEREPETMQAETVGKKILTRAELLALASDLVEQLHCRTTRKVFRETAHDRARLAYARATVAAIQAAASILKDTEIDEIKMRLEAVEDLKL